MSCPPALSSPSGVSDQELQVRELSLLFVFLEINNDAFFFPLVY
jgi:hypothetical protein